MFADAFSEFVDTCYQDSVKFHENEEDFEKTMGLKAEGTSGDYDALDPESYKGVARKAVEQYPNVTHVGTTLRVAKTGLLNDWRIRSSDFSNFNFSLKTEK